jgi:hypothetical protein
MPAKNPIKSRSPASSQTVANAIRTALRLGRRVRIERVGEFQPLRGGEFRFVPELRPSVFLAYVSEDSANVERLFEALRAAGFDPWMDRRKLLPGQNWPRAIEHAIESADFFVACFSSHAVCKRSHFQGEMRYALDCAQLVPFDQVYFIPVRFDACVLPLRIEQHIQAINLFPGWAAAVKRLINLIASEMQTRQAA